MAPLIGCSEHDTNCIAKWTNPNIRPDYWTTMTTVVAACFLILFAVVSVFSCACCIKSKRKAKVAKKVKDDGNKTLVIAAPESELVDSTRSFLDDSGGREFDAKKQQTKRDVLRDDKSTLLSTSTIIHGHGGKKLTKKKYVLKTRIHYDDEVSRTNPAYETIANLTDPFDSSAMSYQSAKSENVPVTRRVKRPINKSLATSFTKPKSYSAPMPMPIGEDGSPRLMAHKHMLLVECIPQDAPPCLHDDTLSERTRSMRLSRRIEVGEVKLQQQRSTAKKSLTTVNNVIVPMAQKPISPGQSVSKLPTSLRTAVAVL